MNEFAPVATKILLHYLKPTKELGLMEVVYTRLAEQEEIINERSVDYGAPEDIFYTDWAFTLICMN